MISADDAMMQPRRANGDISAENLISRTNSRMQSGINNTTMIEENGLVQSAIIPPDSE